MLLVPVIGLQSCWGITMKGFLFIKFDIYSIGFFVEALIYETINKPTLVVKRSQKTNTYTHTLFCSFCLPNPLAKNVDVPGL